MIVGVIATDWLSIGVTRLNVLADKGRGLVLIDLIKNDNWEYIGGDALIWNLCVSADFRRKGIGRGLLECAEMVGRSKGVKRSYLEWSGKDSERWVLDWYVRKGYHIVNGHADIGHCKLCKELS